MHRIRSTHSGIQAGDGSRTGLDPKRKAGRFALGLFFLTVLVLSLGATPAEARVVCGGFDAKGKWLPDCSNKPAKPAGNPVGGQCKTKGSFPEGGKCYICPVGYQRLGGVAVTAPNACYNLGMGWETPKFPVPSVWELGLSDKRKAAIQGARLWDARFYSDPKRINDAVRGFAQQRGISGKNLDNFLEKAWAKDLRPDGAMTNGLIYLGIVYEAATGQGTDFDKNVLKGFEKFIHGFRVHLAQDALNAYDAWQRADIERKRRAPKNLMMLFDYGTKPPDFSKNASVAIQAAGLATGFTAAGAAFSAASAGAGATATNIAGVSWASTAASTVAAAGALAVAAPFAIIAGAAIADFVDIVSARPKLVANLKKASQPVSVKAMLKTDQRKQELGTYWSLVLGQNFASLPAHMKKSLYQSYQEAYARRHGHPKTVINQAYLDSLQNKSLDPNSLASTDTNKNTNTKPLDASSAEVKGTSQTVTVINPSTGQMQQTTITSFDSAAFKKQQAELAALAKLPPGPRKWQKINGAATDIAVDDKGWAWVLGTRMSTNGYDIYQLPPGTTNWRRVPGEAMRISAGDTVWVVNRKRDIYRLNGKRWQKVNGPKAVDIGASSKGVWMLGGDARGNNYGVHKLEGSTWKFMGGFGTRIDVDADGQPWVLASDQTLWVYGAGQWLKMSGAGKDVGVGPIKTAALVGADDQVWRRDGKNGKWASAKVDARAVAVGPDDKAWIIGPKNEIFREK